MLSSWLRVIRIRFLLASVIAVLLGLTITWWTSNTVDIFHAALTMIGVLALHVSIDLLNDYWDFKRGIDTQTKRTKFSGGTGVLPEGLLEPRSVYKAGIAFLIFGSILGAYFIYVNGITIGIILAFAILSIYFYSTKIVNVGLAEFFVGVKGTMIVLGTYFIQTSQIDILPILGGMVIGILSSFVLFITSFPDHDADKDKGRKTLVIILGKKKSSMFFWVFPIFAYMIIIFGVSIEIFPIYSLVTLTTIPLLIVIGKKISTQFNDDEKFLKIMNLTISYSRITGVIFIVSFLILAINII